MLDDISRIFIDQYAPMKHIVLLFGIALLSLSATAQEVKCKKGVVYVDGAECLTYEKTTNIMFTFSTLEGKEIMMLKFPRHPITSKIAAQVTFMEAQKVVSSESYVFNKKVLIEKLLKEGTLENCDINREKIDSFGLKYNEEIDGY